ncbi:hypothetical protein CDCA_CDCA02G0633 [Cyanidium caldarium]|uniref:Hydrophobic seed protein domain-containing protein n=1 Tax=Cyanidium caldarium TaxID=2771 RepID=A0AAV9IRF0_CYACA|nr:hypothetical protein CDCA_CDCA02G0633 [Cyanidium caldarium]
MSGERERGHRERQGVRGKRRRRSAAGWGGANGFGTILGGGCGDGSVCATWSRGEPRRQRCEWTGGSSTGCFVHVDVGALVAFQSRARRIKLVDPRLTAPRHSENKKDPVRKAPIKHHTLAALSPFSPTPNSPPSAYLFLWDMFPPPRYSRRLETAFFFPPPSRRHVIRLTRHVLYFSTWPCRLCNVTFFLHTSTLAMTTKHTFYALFLLVGCLALAALAIPPAAAATGTTGTTVTGPTPTPSLDCGAVFVNDVPTCIGQFLGTPGLVLSDLLSVVEDCGSAVVDLAVCAIGHLSSIDSSCSSQLRVVHSCVSAATSNSTSS